MKKSMRSVLDEMWNELSEKAKDIIADSDERGLQEFFGGCDTPEKVEELVNLYCTDDE